ncbi:putative ABC transporter ATP-binding protein YbhF [Piscirickettsia salmonis]|uniref:ABC transporter family protein n=1 Tax=Piscirickettsia salmonis TaxID=1238 RepID=A0A1L6TD09_PISSA|nr:ABC transporter ATP-binding protein [Piscirickettsia salmonis]AKP74343.1 multidrug ABC transporter ATP-binding protein [Piscirickettsia salmonis LF-89 = ATCC VR-1361]ALB23286.1 ABC transporter family protein [Piscirickettsia salmonis]ALY03192.1 multidrug ABC transporter ATP-binding protein [Piscirickettsia salmonis]AMA42755.1 multidrug ABC transporter ATP-binding protein [Piscirickettsia salmonis]AOS35227.1 multidrug ABC transporter ATP-binding protein [Piscirickettsia salmonis]
MTDIINIQRLSKQYGSFTALDQLNLTIQQGQIIGLIGPNGAGKTSLLKAILGLTPYHGQVSVMGLNPKQQRNRLMEQVCFIADVALLPQWLKVQQAIDYVATVHPKFNRQKAELFINKTNIKYNQKVKELSKGMITQLHLALILAIDVELLVLDEPTLGLDILYRQEFYNQLLEEYHQKKRTIIVATHQIEEVENILSSIIMIQAGKVLLHEEITQLHQQFSHVYVKPEQQQAALALQPLSQKQLPESSLMLFEKPASELQSLGQTAPASLVDIFIAKIKGSR